jgi:trehalose 6-phosphate synthase/phosphatase
MRHFLSSLVNLLGYEHNLGQISIDNRLVKVDAFPMGIDYERYSRGVEDPEVRKEMMRLSRTMSEGKIILSVDRLDYSKGIPERLEAFDLFLAKYPEYREKVTLIMIAVPSRTAVETYNQLKRRVDELVGHINGKYGVPGWSPVLYYYRSFTFAPLTAMYNMSDVALITPIRDGMNLVAKEYLATRTDGKGVLILSEMAGAAKELCEAIIVNPNDRDDVADAIKRALSMPEDEQVKTNRLMQGRIRRYNVKKWSLDFIDRLVHIKGMQTDLHAHDITGEIEKQILEEYANSKSCLLLLDYDGTLKHFVDRPEKAQPDKQILGWLKSLTADPANEVVIISGRDKETLDSWFSDLKVSLIAEHGVWIKDKGEGKRWITAGPMRSDWKKDIRPVLEKFVDRTPGSFVEEKDFSLVWHYRRTPPDFARIRVSELKEVLHNLTEGPNLAVMEGNKVIEIKNAGINKGQAAIRWLAKKRRWGFVMFIGDDVTDEDVFEVMPERAVTIKVGVGPSRARFSLDSVDDVRALLSKFVRYTNEMS